MNAAIMIMCLAGSTAVGQQDTIFKQNSPRLEVKTDTRDGKTMSFVLYNRIYMGRQYHKSKEHPDVHLLPTTYFHDKGPIGVLLKDPKRFPPKKEPPIAVLGMDIGTLAAYAKPGQTFHFTERLPTFVKLSQPDKDGKRYFTYVQDAIDRGADLKIFEGEPRDMIEKHGKDKFYQIIVVETYKLPVIEVHKELMTKEALQMLVSKTREDGIVAFHTSNRYYDLAPIIASAANELKLACVAGKYPGVYAAQRTDDFRFSSNWVMVARHEKHLPRITEKRDPEVEETEWHPPEHQQSARRAKGWNIEKIGTEFLWTDKGEQSFRGLYHSDPEIDKLHDVLHDLEDVARSMGAVNPSQYTRPIRDLIRSMSSASADRLNSPRPKGDEKK